MPSSISDVFISVIKAAPTPQAYIAAICVFAAAVIVWRLIDGFQFSATFRPIRRSADKRQRRKHKSKNLTIGRAPGQRNVEKTDSRIRE
jgi:hypothetical protein